jgi:hypothetical protein
MVFPSTASSNFSSQRLAARRSTLARQGSDDRSILPSKGLPANVTNPDGLTLPDAEELHSRKVKTSVMNMIPYIALPKLMWDAVFFNPSKAAAYREDFLHGERSYASAIQQEKRKKNAQIKASAVPVLLGIPLCLLVDVVPALRTKDPLSKLGICSTPAILTALGYGLIENPKAKDFNEQF